MNKTRDIPKLTKSDVARFKAKIFKTATCWLWTARIMPNGYGQFVISRDSKQHFLSHRVAFEIFKKKIPKGHVVRHTCDTPACVNPKHLVLGGQYDNCVDSFLRGRAAVQTNREALRTKCKLTEEQAIEIKASPLSQRACAAAFNVSPSTVACIRTGRSWNHLA